MNTGNKGVINIGLQMFYDSLCTQGVKATQIDWVPPVKQSDEIENLLRIYCDKNSAIEKRIDKANQKAVSCIVDSDPVWVDILPAGECVEGLNDYTIIHSGPPIDYEDMVMLHKRGMVSACLFEGWAKTEDEAIALVRSGKVKLLSALDTNTVGAGTGIITKSVAMAVIEDRATGMRAATFPAEGIAFQGGFCGWGLYSPEIAENLRYMREELFPPLREMVKKRGGVSLKPILAESMQMGDENHTRQSAADLLFLDEIILDMLSLNVDRNALYKTIKYIVETPRFFHNFGQGASRSAMLSAVGLPYSTMMTACCGNGVEFGIKVAGLGDQWFTAEAPMMEGRYTSTKYTKADQLPWIGDSCVVECAGLGGMAAAASPIVCKLRGMSMADAIAQTKEMQKICIGHNGNFPIPNMDFEFLPIGVDIRKVLRTGITPCIHGGMFNREGGLIGAGMGRVPMECFEKAMKAFAAKYPEQIGQTE